MCEADDFSDKVADGDACGDGEEAEAHACGECLVVAEGFGAEHAVEDEAGQHDGVDEVHDALIVFLFEDFGFPESGTAKHEQVNGQDRDDDGGGVDQVGGSLLCDVGNTKEELWGGDWRFVGWEIGVLGC